MMNGELTGADADAGYGKEQHLLADRIDNGCTSPWSIHLSFIILHSSFCIHHSSFKTCRGFV